MTTFAYGSKPGTFASIREEAKESWRGITASLNNQPYLVIGKEGNKFVLEGEDGDIQTLESFQWTQATEGSRLVSASRHPEAALTKGSVFGQFTVGNLAHEDGEWYVRNGNTDEVLPLEWIADRLEKLKNDPGDLAWDIRLQAAKRFGIDYGVEDLKCPMCQSRNVGFDQYADDAHCQDCGHVGPKDEFVNDPPDYDGDHGEWYPDFHGSSFKEAEYHYIRQEGDKYCIWQKSTGKTLSCHASKEEAEAAFRAMEMNMHGSAKLAATFSMPMPPEGIHFRTHSAMQEAGISGQVQYPPLPGTEYEQGLVGEFPGRTAIDEMDYTTEVEDAGMNPQDITLQVTVPDGQEEQARQIINQLGGVRESKVAIEMTDQDNGPGDTDLESENRAVKCPNCGSHTIRSFGVMKGEASLKCLTCGTEFKRPAMENPESKVAEDAHKFVPGQRVLLTHPNWKGERGSIVDYSGKHADLGEEQYEIQLDSGDKITNIPESVFKKIKSAKVNNSDLPDSASRYFIDSMVYIADSYPDGKGLQMDTLPLTEWDDNKTPDHYDPKPRPGLLEPEEEKSLCPMCHEGEGTSLGAMGAREYFRCKNCGMDWSQPNVSEAEAWGKPGEDPDKMFGQDGPSKSFGHTASRLDSKGNELEAGRVYLMSGKNYTVPDLVRILNLEHDRIEAAIASDAKGAFPIIIEASDEPDYKFEPVAHEDGEKKEASGWKLARTNWSSKDQRDLVEENPRGRARNIDKLDLSGTHYELKSSTENRDFLWGI